MKAWKIFYGDGSVVGSAHGTPAAAPSLNVQAIAQEDDVDIGRRTISGYDFYWCEDGYWFGGDLFGLFDFLQRTGAVKFGRALPRAQYRAILARAVTDPDLTPKHAWDPEEHRP